ncbi:S-adenosyl-L-methionine-dependent methyltransferase [Gymnopilus junonius]|uniref:S-adenosyl-L-methionine-dependent methyltransferase n=1 Tax=Gymnopilus junonius TaxID=109634 RepID=A0A9P5NNH1_GYMJU|nr:S-adenosyl-L-methionine-dependent methyltransferase [Gymnopilus junonius]
MPEEHDHPHPHMHHPVHLIHEVEDGQPSHGYGKTKDYATSNKEHYNKPGASMINEQIIELAKRSAQAILDRYPFDENSTTLMDFACNVGLLSRELAPHTKLLIGVDISQTPVDDFNEHVFNQGIPAEEMRAICSELKGEEGELDGLKFDVITCSASYHHFEDITKITKILTFFLKPGGTLLVVDMTQNTHSHADGSSSSSAPSSNSTLFPEQFHHVVAHVHGISQEAVKDAFDAAGLCCFTFEPFSTVKIQGNEGTLFVAKGKKPISS